MFEKFIISFLLIHLSIFNGIGQPTPFPGTLLFNLSEKEHGQFFNIEDLENKNIQIMSYNEYSGFRYDTTHKAFAYTTTGFEHKEFIIIYNSDTTFIHYPSLLSLDAVFIKAPIPLNGKSFSFSDKQTYDAIHSNIYYNQFVIFYLCQGCFISDYYEMSEEMKMHSKKALNSYPFYTIKLRK
jgi:hypothetical protein